MSFSTEVKECLKKNRENTKNKCCRRAFDAGLNGGEYVSRCDGCDHYFIAGVFCSCGSVNSPRASANLSISAPEKTLETVGGILSRCGLPMKSSTRNGQKILYLRKKSSVEDFLTFVGASHYSVMIMEESVMNELKISSNRLTNADVANQDRASRASAEQLKAIRKLIKDKRLYKLPQEYIRTAELRLENPELTIPELASLFEPAISKSGLSHRLKKLIAFSKMPPDDNSAGTDENN